MKNQDCMCSKKSIPTPILRRCLNLVFPHRSFSHNGPRNVDPMGGTLNFNGGFRSNTTGNDGRFLNVVNEGNVWINGYSRTDDTRGSEIRTGIGFTGVLSLGGLIDASHSSAITHRGGVLELRNDFDLPTAEVIEWQAYADSQLRAGSGGATIDNLVRVTSIDGSQAFQNPEISGSEDLTLNGGFRFETENSDTTTLVITNTGKTTFGGNEFWIGNTSSPARSMEMDIADGSYVEISAQVRKGDSLTPTNPADLTLSGGGTLELSNANNIYNGTTTVANGTLLVTGVLTDDGNTVTVQSDGVLGGNGTINRDIFFESGARFVFDPFSTLNTGNASVSFDDFWVTDLLGLDTFGGIGEFTLIDGSGINFTGVNNWGVENAHDLGDGRSAYFEEGSLKLVVIPEPGTLVLLGIALGTLAIFRRRK
ncbi:MAG: PEP-CTERM sorting domain-containing protein [Kiritimatiellae bacterium]|nr:PEP-CTERM sorting domain-containing protein [Kiritimatiellia bacterium]